MGLGIGIGTELAIENGIGSQQGRLSGASMGLNIENSMGFTTGIISFSPMHNYRADWYAGRDDPEVGQDDQGHRGKNRHQACHKASFEAVAEHAHRQREATMTSMTAQILSVSLGSARLAKNRHLHDAS